MKFEGKVRIYEKDEKGEFTKFVRESKNLWVDDSKELTLDFLWGLKSWWNPKDQEEYAGGDSGWDTVRYVGVGESMFANASFERASGIDGIPSGDEYDYQVAETYLVSPEDSFLSAEITTLRPSLTITRRDQTVEIRTTVSVPGNVDLGEEIREFAMFLKSTGPSRDPSLHETSKSSCMLCRSALFGTGYYNESGPCASGDEGAKMCYYDDPYTTTDDIELLWIFGEL